MFRRVFKYSLVVFLLALPVMNVAMAATMQPNLFKKNREDTLKGGNQEAFLENATFHNVAQICQTVGGVCDKDKVDVKNIILGKGPSGLGNLGMVGMMGRYTSLAFSQPISGIEYLANAKDQLLGKPAYAQTGVGFAGLQPILPVWRMFRNIVYTISSVLFVFLGLMIILRVKVNPQTVVSIQSAIPSVVSTLILVTFSYAIAGLLIDLMTLLQAVVIAMVFAEPRQTWYAFSGLQYGSTPLGQNLFPDRNQVANNIPFLNYIGIDFSIGFPNWNYNGGLFDKIWGALLSISKPFNFAQLNTGGAATYFMLANNLIPTTVMQLIFALVGSLLLGVISGGTLAGVFPIAFGVLQIILMVVILIYIVKLFFGLMKNYFYILFKIMIAPIEIAVGAIPGSKGGFNTWFWDLLGNLMVFPLVLIVLVISNYVIYTLSVTSGALWAPTLLDITFDLGVIGALGIPGVSNIFISFAIGFGTLMLLSQFPTLIPQVIFSLKPSAWESAIGKESSQAIAAPYRGITNAQEAIGVWAKNRGTRGGDNGKPTAKPSPQQMRGETTDTTKAATGRTGGSPIGGNAGSTDEVIEK